ncbi:hypothetical protein H2201_004887 [Coniosporium apollinis]|uniref:Xylanolytic transcriptional activator regulatory domain-containing protein n=1 Tax=Coniosporium apollinis TaxID=61459 RepID=A0ABQ9NS91_9PEZI|nr:hypothetical protein H2201_004887 [Coniosporium apollinis]
MDDAALKNFEPLAFMVFYAAVNSLQPSETVSEFRVEKDPLLQKYRQGLELALERADFLTTSSIEVLQAFMMLLTCDCKKESSGKPYALVGAAIRIATAQGLHREPTLFSSASMDEITIELRRRLWYQIVDIDIRTAGSKGQEPILIFIQCVCLVETVLKYTVDNGIGAQRFQWHIGSDIMFYPIMHLISELRSSPFQSSEQAPLRERALAGLRNILQMKRVANVHTWLVMERMIEKLSADHARGSLGVTPGLTLTPPSITPEVPSEPLPKTTSVKDPVIAQPYFGTEFGTGTTAGSLHKAASYEYTDTAFSVNTFASTIAFEAQDSSYFPDEFTWSSLDVYFPDYSGNRPMFF